MLASELMQSGWRLAGWTHYQFLLFPLFRQLRRRSRTRRSSFERSPPPVVNAVLGWVNHLEVRLLHRRRLPAGSSLFAWAIAA
jgi:hypothetical protein